MPRYENWRKLIGDTDRPDLLDAGKRLLGQLEEQRRLGGPRTIAAQRQMPDGSIVRARFDGEIPVIEVIAAPTEERPGQVREIEGFIVRPSPEADQDANTDLNQVLLLFGGTYKPTFYDAAHIPPGLEAGTYTKTFATGLDYGNVDWRNDSKHMQVNWLGPNGRYFGDTEGSYGGPLVWCKGRVLFDTREPYASALGIFETAVQGACLRGRLWLYVVVRTNTVETLVRFRVHSEAEAKRARALGLANIEEHRFADLILDPASGEVLASHTIPTNNGVHPWFFNASGTVAKRIDCSNSSNGNIEWTLTEAEDGTWSFTSVQHRSTRTISEVLDWQEEQVGLEYTTSATDGYGNVEVNVTNAYVVKSLNLAGDAWNAAATNWTYDDFHNPGDDVIASGTDRDYSARTGTFTRTDTRSQELLPAIVDFRGDAVVYGYGTVGAEITNYNRSLASRSGSGSFVGEITLGASSPSFTASYVHTTSEVQTYSYNESSTRYDDGLTTDFLTVQAGRAFSNVGSETVELFRDITFDYVSSAVGDDYQEMGQDNASTEVTDQIELHFVDLRYRHAYLHTKRITVEKAVTGTVRITAYPVTTPANSGAWTQNQTTTTQKRVMVMVNGALHVDHTDTQVDMATGDIYTGADLGTGIPPSLALFSSVSTSGSTEAYTDDEPSGYYKLERDRTANSALFRGALLSGSNFQMRDPLDFHGSDLFTMGSIVSKGDRYVYSLGGKDTPPTGELPYFNAIDTGDLGALTGNQVDVVRYFPISYLPRTVLVR